MRKAWPGILDLQFYINRAAERSRPQLNLKQGRLNDTRHYPAQISRRDFERWFMDRCNKYGSRLDTNNRKKRDPLKLVNVPACQVRVLRKVIKCLPAPRPYWESMIDAYVCEEAT